MRTVLHTIIVSAGFSCSYRSIFLLSAALAPVCGYQFALLDIKLRFPDQLPFVETAPAQGITPVNVRQLLFFECQNVSH